jgi:hypothetical protein
MVAGGVQEEERNLEEGKILERAYQWGHGCPPL